jgi:hypothetical protein
VELLPWPTHRCDATTVGAISRKGGEIDICNPQTNITLSSITLSCQVYCGPKLSDDEAISASIRKSRCMARLGSVKTIPRRLSDDAYRSNSAGIKSQLRTDGDHATLMEEELLCHSIVIQQNNEYEKLVCR